MLIVRVQRCAAVRLLTTLGLVLGPVALASGCNDGPEPGLFQQDGRNLDIVGDDASESDTIPVPDTSIEVDTAAQVDSAEPVDSSEDVDSTDSVDVNAVDSNEPEDTYIGAEPWTEPIGPDCTSDDECTGGLKCDELYGTCVECVRPTECGSEARCDRWQCVPTQWCFTDDDCQDSPFGGACKASDQYCIPCYEDWHCDSDEICVDGQCNQTVACVNSLGCPGTQICNETGRCIDCVSDADCGDGNRCTPDRECSLECDSDNDCKDLDMVCSQDGGFCAAPAVAAPPEPEPIPCEVQEDCIDDGYRCWGPSGARSCVKKACITGQMRCANTCRDRGQNCDQPATNHRQKCGANGEWGLLRCGTQQSGGTRSMCAIESTLELAACQNIVCDSAWSVCLTATTQFGCFPSSFSPDPFYPGVVTCNCDDGECIPSPSN